MNATKKLQSAAIVLIVPIAGVLALVLFEVMRSLAGGTYDPEATPPIPMLVGMLCVAAIPVILLAWTHATAVRWAAFGIAVLMALFHAMHILEHVMSGDIVIMILILITMFIPNLDGALLIWQARKEE
ncbi:MAG: hypothetical protein AAF512_26785 [Pseudomonadota bacterium]